jgi:hypothetical protein
MKRTYIVIILIVAGFSSAIGQSKFNIGGGYFGHTASYPGIVIEAEWESIVTEKASIPLRVDLGMYFHKRYHTGVFADVNYGFRQYLKSGFYLEESVGVGVLMSFLSNDATYEVTDAGEVNEISGFSTVDFMPSITLGVGYNVTKNRDVANYVWLRPKLFWQYPHKTTSTYNAAVQVGYTHTLSSK